MLEFLSAGLPDPAELGLAGQPVKDHWLDLVISGLLALGMLALAVAVSALAWVLGLWVLA